MVLWSCCLGAAGLEWVASATPPAVLAVKAMAATALATMIVVVVFTGDLRAMSWESGRVWSVERNAARAAGSRMPSTIAAFKRSTTSAGMPRGPQTPYQE